MYALDFGNFKDNLLRGHKYYVRSILQRNFIWCLAISKSVTDSFLRSRFMCSMWTSFLIKHIYSDEKFFLLFYQITARKYLKNIKVEMAGLGFIREIKNSVNSSIKFENSRKVVLIFFNITSRDQLILYDTCMNTAFFMPVERTPSSALQLQTCNGHYLSMPSQIRDTGH